ncbi:L-arabinose isomerase [Spirosoma daeguense]
MLDPIPNVSQVKRKPIIEMRKVGLFGAGYSKCWRQFAGSSEEMQHKKVAFIQKIETGSLVDIVNFGHIDGVHKAYILIPKLNAANLDLIFCKKNTYTSISTSEAAIRHINIPVVLVALQPDNAMYYSPDTTSIQRFNDDICSWSEFAGYVVRIEKKMPDLIIGTLFDDPQTDAQIENYCRIAVVLHDLKTGTRETVDLEKLIVNKKLDGLVCCYEVPPDCKAQTILSNFIEENSLLTGPGISIDTESNLKTCFAMLIMERIRIYGSVPEFHPVDCKGKNVLIGHTSPLNVATARRKAVFRSPTKHRGKSGIDKGVELMIREGPITMLPISSTFDG